MARGWGRESVALGLEEPICVGAGDREGRGWGEASRVGVAVAGADAYAEGELRWAYGGEGGGTVVF